MFKISISNAWNSRVDFNFIVNHRNTAHSPPPPLLFLYLLSFWSCKRKTVLRCGFLSNLGWTRCFSELHFLPLACFTIKYKNCSCTQRVDFCVYYRYLLPFHVTIAIFAIYSFIIFYNSLLKFIQFLNKQHFYNLKYSILTH